MIRFTLYIVPILLYMMFAFPVETVCQIHPTNAETDTSLKLHLTFDQTEKDSLPIDQSPNNVHIQVDGTVKYGQGPDGEDDRALLFTANDTTELYAHSPKIALQDAPAAVSFKFNLPDSTFSEGILMDADIPLTDDYFFPVEFRSDSTYLIEGGFTWEVYEGNFVGMAQNKAVDMKQELMIDRWYKAVLLLKNLPEFGVFTVSNNQKLEAKKYEPKLEGVELVDGDTSLAINPDPDYSGHGHGGFLIDDIKINDEIPAKYKTLTGIESHRHRLPQQIVLVQNYPNPFNPSTNIQFRLPEATNVQLTVYNTIGQKIETLVNRQMRAGSHLVTFNAGGLPSGVYIYQLKAGEFSESREMLLVK